LGGRAEENEGRGERGTGRKEGRREGDGRAMSEWPR